TQLLRLRHRRRQMFVAQEVGRLIPEHRETMLRRAAQFPVCDSMSHICWRDGLEWRDGPDGISCLSCPSCLSCLLLILISRGRLDSHAEAEAHRVQDLLDLVQALAPEVLRLEHLCLVLLHH